MDKHEIRKSALEWATKQKSITDFQQFLEENKNMVPTSVTACAQKLASSNQGKIDNISEHAYFRKGLSIKHGWGR